MKPQISVIMVRYLFACLLLVVVGCAKNNSFVELSQTGTINVSGESQRVEIDVESSGEWKVTQSHVDWCVIEKHSTGLVAVLKPNIEPAIRSVDLAISSGEVVKYLTLVQANNYVFKLPVIAHVFYADETKPLQYIHKGRVAELIVRANTMLAQNNVGVELVPATTYPDGTPLDEAGVRRVKWMGAYPINDDEFGGNKQDFQYSWDPNEYVNLYFYIFMGGSAGYSYYPRVPSTHPLGGLLSSDHGRLELDDASWLPGVFINSEYIYEDAVTPFDDDVTQTLVHELGHYLGLYHSFYEPEPYDDLDDTTCLDTDYCPDTKSYNRVAYENYIQELDDDVSTLEIRLRRTACSGETFVSDNVMDYYTTWGNRFSGDQCKRMRHVLAYGLLIPGPKAIVVPDQKQGVRSVRLQGQRVE